jgi:hypothetical protein
MQGNQKTSGPMGQIGKWVFIALWYCPRAEMSLRCRQNFPGKEECFFGQLSTAVCPSIWLLKICQISKKKAIFSM